VGLSRADGALAGAVGLTAKTGSGQFFLDDLVAHVHALGADPRFARCCHGWDLLAALPAEAARLRRVLTDLVHGSGHGPGFGSRVEHHVRDIRASAADVYAWARDQLLDLFLGSATERAGQQLRIGGHISTVTSQ